MTRNSFEKFIQFEKTIDLILGTTYSLFWILSEAGRAQGWYFSVPLLLLGGLISTSRKLPVLSFVLLVFFGMTQIIPEFRVTNPASALISLGYLSFWLGFRKSRFFLSALTFLTTLLVSYLGRITSLFAIWKDGDESLEAFDFLPLFLIFSTAVLGVVVNFILQASQLHDENRRLEAEITSDRAELFIQQERLQVADELHDVLAQTLAAISLQAEGARAQNNHEITNKALKKIGLIARSGLSELRQLLESLRDYSSNFSQKGIDDIPELLSYSRITGLKISLMEKGTKRKLIPLLEHLAFRILQESLTNALKYSDITQKVKVEIVWGTEELQIQIQSKGSNERFTEISSGYGIESLKRRVNETGGKLVFDFGNERSPKSVTTRATLPIVRV